MRVAPTLHPAGGPGVGRMSHTVARGGAGDSGDPTPYQDWQPRDHTATIRGRRTRRGERDAEAGQSLVEFSLILMPLFLILLGIIQFGFIFSTYVTMTNAARDAARLGTIYAYDRPRCRRPRTTSPGTRRSGPR